MTGISLDGKQEQVHHLPAEAYLLKKIISERFSIIQIGICLFHKSPTGGYVARPFNFFVFPQQGGDIILSPGAIAFNRRNGMDFQRWICDGIPYVNGEGEKQLCAQYFPDETQRDGTTGKQIELQREEDKTWFADAWEKYLLWLQLTPSEENREFRIPNCTQLQRAYFEGKVSDDHPTYTFSSRFIRPVRAFFVVRMTAEEKKAAEERDALRKKTEFEQKLGFRAIYKLLVGSKKPIVGHNCYFDLLFLWATFEGTLPSFLIFKKELLSRFPVVYDTKYLAKSDLVTPPFENTGLESLYVQLKATEHFPALSLPLGFESYNQIVLDSFKQGDKGSRAHEAAYDAYMTGALFLALQQQIGQQGTTKLSNKLNNMSSLFDIDLAHDKDIFTPKGPAVCVFNLTKDVRTVDLEAATGSLTGRVLWVTDTYAYIIFGEMVSPDEVLQQLQTTKFNGSVKLIDASLQD
eukprot:TRINITY_DN1128_c0_g1_i1.p1 TRINITY_DN1128_c0_g1~~TRINITY_DN1128_c0_g1_i1.p1  ORF type:complete len:501 (+),score=105.87 TRINITY_DN1128_c0_g1_i1:117-1505(+)